jgi:hypothetical protein
MMPTKIEDLLYVVIPAVIMSSLMSEADQVKVGLIDEAARAVALYEVWDIIINKDYNLFGEWIKASSLLARNELKRKQFEEERFDCMKNTSSNCTGTCGSHCHLVLTEDMIAMNARAREIEDQCAIDLIETNSTIERVMSLLARDVPLEYIKKDLAEVKNTDDCAGLLDILSRQPKERTKQFARHFACILSTYEDYSVDMKSEELIRQALQHTCSVDVELAKKVSKLHGNLTHALENGEQCQRCQAPIALTANTSADV